MTDKFPLFRLPHVALCEVLNYFRPEATLPLSLCSKKSKRLVKHCQEPRKKIDIELNVSENVLEVYCDPIISVNAVASLPTDYEFETVDIGSHKVPVKMENGILNTYWVDEEEGLKEVTKYTLDVFNRDLCAMAFRETLLSYDIRDWLEWIKIRQGTLRDLLLLSEMETDDDLLMYILESDIVTGDLDLLTSSFPEFRGPPPRPYSINSLYLAESKWITFDHLLAMDIKQITLNYSLLTSPEINVFLKKWINGECSKRIKVLIVGIKNVGNYDLLMEGIEFNRKDPSLRRVYATSCYSVEHILGGFDVKRKEDGAMATVVKQPQGFLTMLKVVFWPDYKGTSYH